MIVPDWQPAYGVLEEKLLHVCNRVEQLVEMLDISEMGVRGDDISYLSDGFAAAMEEDEHLKDLTLAKGEPLPTLPLWQLLSLYLALGISLVPQGQQMLPGQTLFVGGSIYFPFSTSSITIANVKSRLSEALAQPQN
jgi:hypothetical protein